jgi:drug/metabolite transporter (DMT)-like permease
MSHDTRPSVRAPVPALTSIALVGAAACWGVGTVLTKQVVDDVAPLTLLPVQLAASCVVLGTLAAVGRAPLRRTPALRPLATLGVLNPGLAYALGLVGLTSITASMSVLLWAAEPVLIAVLAVLVLRDRIEPVVAATLAVAVAGVLLVVYQPGAAGAPVGIALTLAAVGCCALYTVLTRRLLLDDSSLTVALAQQAMALGFAVALATMVQLAGGDGWSLAGHAPTTWLLAAASGVVYYGLAFWLYLGGLRGVPATVAGAYLPLIPVFGVAAGYLAGERLVARQWWGAALVVAATLALAAYQRRAETATP